MVNDAADIVNGRLTSPWGYVGCRPVSPLSCPGRAATRKRCCAEPGPKPHGSRSRQTWAPALQRTAEEALRCVRGTRSKRGAPLRKDGRPYVRLLLHLARIHLDRGI